MASLVPVFSQYCNEETWSANILLESLLHSFVPRRLASQALNSRPMQGMSTTSRTPNNPKSASLVQKGSVIDSWGLGCEDGTSISKHSSESIETNIEQLIYLAELQSL